MKPRRKSLLLLVTTLVLGVLLGASGTSVLQNRRAAQLRMAREIGGMMRMVEGVIRVEDEVQRSQIRAVVEDSEDRFRDARRTCGHLFQTQRDTMVASLRTVLTSEQQAELDDWVNRELGDQHRSSRRNGKRSDRRNR